MYVGGRMRPVKNSNKEPHIAERLKLDTVAFGDRRFQEISNYLELDKGVLLRKKRIYS